MKKFLLDTSVIIDFLRRKDKEETLFYKLSGEDISISVITHTELFAGKSVWEKEEIHKMLNDLFEGVTIIPLSEEISEKAGFIRALGQSNTLIDSIIGATAVVSESTLVTLNKKDFEKIEEIVLF
jgi:tRNA(fMet)-specific endonuclease VapC